MNAPIPVSYTHLDVYKRQPKEDEIKADNAARQEWNRTADMALLSGISEAKILEVKQTEIHEKEAGSIVG